MNINIITKLENITTETKTYATEKGKKLEKFYKLRKLEIFMDMEGEQYSVQFVVSPERGGNTIVGAAKASDWPSAIDQASDKVERQLRKHKEKVKSHRIKKQRTEGKDTSKDDEESYDDVVDR